MRHQRVAAARLRIARPPQREGGAEAASRGRARYAQGRPRAERVAAELRHRPAEPDPRAPRSGAPRGSSRYWRRDQRALGVQPRSGARRAPVARSRGASGRRRARCRRTRSPRGGRAPPRACGGTRRPRRRSRARAAAGRRIGPAAAARTLTLRQSPGGRAARRTRSCRRRPPRRVEARERVAGRDQIGALVPDSSQRLTSWTPVCRAVVVALTTGARSGPRSAGTAGPRARRRAASIDRGPSVGRSLHPRPRTPRSPQAPPHRPTSRRAPPRIDTASQQPSAFQMFPIPATLRWSSSASPNGPRLVVVAQPPQERGRGRTRPPARRARAPPAAGRTACAPRSSARAAGPSNSTTSVSPTRRTSHARRGDRPQRRPARSRPRHPVIPRCEWITSRPRTRGTGACRACRRVATARPSSRSAQRSSACRGCGVRISSGTRPTSTGRIRFAAYAIVSPSGTAGSAPQALSVSRRGPSWNPSASSAGPSREPIAGSPSTFSSASRLIRPRRTSSTSAASAG